MRNILVKLSFVLIFGLILSAPSGVHGESTLSDRSAETDRVLVKITDALGNETINSMPWDEFERLKNGPSIRIASLQKIDMLEPDYIRYTGTTVMASVQPLSWGTERIGAKDMQKKLTDQKNHVIVAVIDTGVDYTHSLLKDRVVDGYDFVDNDTDPMDVQYHGTHVAGIIADSTPVNVKIMPIRTLDEKGNGYDSDVAKSIRFAVDHGAAVINMSFGGDQYSSYLANAIDYALSKSVLVVVSSGNDGSDTATYYPASEQKVIVVTATDQTDNVADFSNTGVSVDLSAPGVGIVSSIPGERYGRMDGTSMATPYVSAAAAMIKLDNPTKSIQELEQLLKKYVDDRGPKGWDSHYGEGIVNVSTYEKSSLVKDPLTSANYIALPSQKDIALDKNWSIKLDRILSDHRIITFKLYNGDSEIPVTISPNLKNKEILVMPSRKYEPNSVYRLEIRIKNGKAYQLQFVTTS